MDKKKALVYYEHFLEEVEEQASEEVRATYESMRSVFDKYLSAIEADMFQQAFRYGYEQGARDAQAEKVVQE